MRVVTYDDCGKITNSYYLSTESGTNGLGGTTKTSTQLKSLVSTLGSSFK